MPGTKIKINSDEAMQNYDAIINFAWHINDEIVNLRAKGFKNNIYKILPSFEKI